MIRTDTDLMRKFINQELRKKYDPRPTSLAHLSNDEVEQRLLAEVESELETNRPHWRQKYREQRESKENQRRNQFHEGRLAKAKAEREAQKDERLRAERVLKKQQQFLKKKASDEN